MHLKSLTLRGFKSFADPTTLEFEPGVTVVVGPNGSGKSNVVDAVAWVLGAQGPRVVRSSKMDDVIFAGTSARPPLGRAEVTLTIDNSSRKLPVDLAEVTITRTLFRTGESEYSMNGVACRLLDIQEMLSDAGVGRQQHVIMGQGQLATVLDARPEDRRAVIEEAAGILKFRRRRERAERRLEATEANLLRLQDLLREVRRQLRPLERQAQAARRHGALAEELRLLRLYVAGRELDSLQRRLAENETQRAALGEEEERLKATLARLDSLIDAGEASLSTEQASDIASLLASAERVRERARGVGNVIAERRRRVEAALAATAETDLVASLEAESARLERELAVTAEAGRALHPERDLLDQAVAELERLEEQFDRTAGTNGALRPPVRTGDLRRARDQLAAQLSRARESLARANERSAAIERQRSELGQRLAAQRRALTAMEGRVAEARAAQIEAEQRERAAADEVTEREAESRAAAGRAHGLHARADALRQALDEANARAGVERLAGRPGVLGTLLDVVHVDSGYERAFEAAVEEALSAVVVDGEADARRAIEHLHEHELHGAVLPLPPASGVEATSTELASTEAASGDPVGTEAAGTAGEGSLRARVRGTHPGADALLDRLLAGVVLCEGSIGEALDLAAAGGPRTVVVTRHGDRLSASGWRLGAGRAGATRAALVAVVDEAAQAEASAASAGERAEEARRAWSSARAVAAVASRAAAAAGAEHRQSEAQLEDVERQLLQLASEAEQVDAAQAEAARTAEHLEAELADRELALWEAEQAEAAELEVASGRARERHALDERARELARLRADFDVRVASIGERATVLAQRRDEIESRLAGYESARSEAAERRQVHEGNAVALARIAVVVQGLITELDRGVHTLGQRQREHDETVTRISVGLSTHRHERSAAERDLTATREQVQRQELERAELRVRLETALETIRHDLDVEVADALAAECPELPPGTPPAARVRELERELRLLGPINPLALEELAGLEERDRFLGEQLEDVRNTRRELGRVIRAVDQEIVSVFTDAFADVADHFEQLFSTLFPGGSGRLAMIDPEDPLSTGIEIEARPAGRNVRRLSLLSGGERSLVALAFLFAVFRSRPSPFYLMDEVEAALDDVNLHRFLDLVDEFRSEAQLVIVSHQKRTMESADVIYGVTMQAGGASKVVSERLRGEAAATA